MSEIEGVRSLGTLGVLLRAVDRRLMPSGEAKELIDLLVGKHSFRIGVEVYQAVLARLLPEK